MLNRAWCGCLRMEVKITREYTEHIFNFKFEGLDKPIKMKVSSAFIEQRLIQPIFSVEGKPIGLLLPELGQELVKTVSKSDISFEQFNKYDTEIHKWLNKPIEEIFKTVKKSSDSS